MKAPLLHSALLIVAVISFPYNKDLSIILATLWLISPVISYMLLGNFFFEVHKPKSKKD